MSRLVCASVSNADKVVEKQQRGSWESYIAISKNNTSLLRRMLQLKKVDPSSDFRGTTLLAAAIHKNAPDIVKLLLEHGADPDKKSDENGRFEPPVITATRFRNLEVVKMLVDHGANLSRTNFYEQDVIYQAVVANAFNILAELLRTVPGKISPIASSGLRAKNVRKVRQLLVGNERACLSRCPIYLAITEGEGHKSKMKSLLIFIKYRYVCNCWLDTSHFWKILLYKDNESKRMLVKWIYLSYGVNLVADDYSAEDGINLNLPKTVKLTNLARIQIRSLVSSSKIVISRRATFFDSISSLPLPQSLISFLLMNDIPIAL